MAIRYGNLNGGGGGGLWKFNPTAPGTNIELNTSAGVTGIAAPLPGFPNLNMVFQEVSPGVPFGGFINYLSPTKFVGVLVNGLSGQEAGSIAALDLVTGAEASKNSYFNGIGKPAIGGFVSDGADTFNEDTASPDNYLREIKNEATDDSTEDQQSIDAREVGIYKSGVEVFRLRIDENGFALYNSAGANLLFQIADTGEILTNQTEAATGTDTTIVGRFPVHDETGTLIGYSPLMVNP